MALLHGVRSRYPPNLFLPPPHKAPRSFSLTLRDHPSITFSYPCTYMPGHALRAPGGWGSQNFFTIGTWRWQGCQPYAPAAFSPQWQIVTFTRYIFVSRFRTLNKIQSPYVYTEVSHMILRLQITYRTLPHNNNTSLILFVVLRPYHASTAAFLQVNPKRTPLYLVTSYSNLRVSYFFPNGLILSPQSTFDLF